MGSVAAGEQPLLLDTVAFIFWHAASPRLSNRARTAMQESLTRPIFVSAVSAFEISTKVRLGKLVVPPALLSDFEYVAQADGFRVMPLNLDAAVRAGQFTSMHRDPFDRLLAAQALENDFAVVTNDPAFASEFDVSTWW